MTMRKLVELDGEYGGWLEIDPVKLRRVALAFQQWLLAVDPNNDPHGFVLKDLPLVEKALEGSLTLPFRQSNPHNWEIREGLLDWYLEIAAPFYNTIRGALNDPPQVIMKDGRYYAWADFEEPFQAEDEAPTKPDN